MNFFIDDISDKIEEADEKDGYRADRWYESVGHAKIEDREEGEFDGLSNFEEDGVFRSFM